MRRRSDFVSTLEFVTACTAAIASTAAIVAAVPQSQAPPRLSTSIDVIRLDVSAVDGSGRAISDLRPDEFEVKIDGTPRRVVVARFGGSAAGDPVRDAAGSAAALLADGRAITFVVDAESLRSGAERALLESAAALVSGLPPQDTVALVPVPGRALDLSRDRGPVVQALRQIKGGSPVFNHDFTFEEAVAMQRGDRVVSQAVVERECVHDPVPRQCPREIEVETRQRVADARAHADHVLAALSGVARAMGPLDTPRSVVLISGGLAFEPDALERFRMAEDAMRSAGVAFYAIHVEQRQGDASTMGTASAGNSSSGLASLASSLGGVFYTGVASGRGIFNRLRAELTESYLLAVESQPGDRDGRAHEIGVTVRRTGVRAAARPRWVAPRRLTSPAPPPAAPTPAAPQPAAAPEPAPILVTPAAPVVPPAPRAAVPVAPAKIDDAALDEVMTRVSQYVTTYGERASAVVASEKYSQSVEGESLPRTRPRQMVAELALVKIARASGWVGYRDVIEVNGKAVQDRRDRLIKALADSASPLEDAARIANESSRYNVGPVIRNFNVPTTALFFFDQANRGRFAYKREGTRRIEGIETWQIAFREVRTPTIVMTAAGRDVPARGTIWVNPADGTVVRTRLQLQGFADSVTGTIRDGTVAPTSARQRLSMTDIESHADVDVTYRHEPRLQMWVPATMAEEYQGAIPRGNQPPIVGTSRSRAVYSDYRQFQTGARLSAPRDKQ